MAKRILWHDDAESDLSQSTYSTAEGRVWVAVVIVAAEDTASLQLPICHAAMSTAEI